MSIKKKNIARVWKFETVNSVGAVQDFKAINYRLSGDYRKMLDNRNRRGRQSSEENMK